MFAIAACNGASGGASDCGPGDLEIEVNEPPGCIAGPLLPDYVALDVYLRGADLKPTDASYVSDDYTRFVFAIPSWANENEIGEIDYRHTEPSGEMAAQGTAAFAVDRRSCITRAIGAGCLQTNYDAGAFAPPVRISALCTSRLPDLPTSQPP